MKIAAKILTFIVTLLINSGIGFFMFGALLVAMNGFPSSKSAEPGMILYTVWVIVSTIVVSLLSVLAVYFLDNKKEINSWLAALISVVAFSIIGGISIVIGWGAGLVFASYLFTNR